MNQLKSKYNFKRYCKTGFNSRLQHQKQTGINLIFKMNHTTKIKLNKRTRNSSNKYKFLATGWKVYQKQQALKAAYENF